MAAESRYPSLFQINSRVWLQRLSREAGKPITLADIKMDAGYGQVVEGQIDNQAVFTAQGLGSCAYNGTWRRSS